MTTVIKKEVVISNSEHLNIDVDLPAGLPLGKALMTVTIEPENQKQRPINRAKEMRGKGKGKVWISDDFDAPLDDFAEYM